MKGIVIYFTIFGHNRRAAEKIAEKKKYDLLEFAGGSILRVPIYLIFKKGLMKKAKQISVTDYEEVIICGPIWSCKPSPPIRALLESLDLKGKNISCYLTSIGKERNSEEIVKDLIAKKLGKIKEVKVIDITKVKV